MIILSIATTAQAERIPMRESILTQLMSSQYDYAEMAHTGIIFHYGNVTINPDNFSLEEIETLELIMRKGRFE